MHFWLNQSVRTMTDLWVRADWFERIAYGSGLLLILAGFVHIPVFLIDTTSWEADASWRKPILFGISTGLTLLSVAWVSSLCKWPTRFVTLLFTVAALVEVLLITLQTWRGEPSHYNYSTSINAWIQYSIEICALLLTLGIAWQTVCLFSGKLHIQNSAYRLAAQSGMLYLLAACLFGIWMVVYGADQLAANQAPEVYGEAGVLKFVHGLPIHAIQLFPLALWIAIRRGMSEADSWKVVLLLCSGVGFVTIYGIIQTFSGKARFDWIATSLPFLIASVVFVMTAVALMIKGPANESSTGPHTAQE